MSGPPARIHQYVLHRVLAAAVAALACVAALAAPGIALADAPDPGGDQGAQISLPVPGKEFGFSGLFTSDGFFNDYPGPAAQAALIRAAGGNAARMPVEWWGLEPERDQWSLAAWSRVKTTYDAMLAAGITPHLTLQNAPPWARDPAFQSCLSRSWCHYPPARDMLGEWDQFVAKVERAFPRATLEIWNEENSLGMWRSGVDPARYAELLAHAYDAAHQVNPNARVMMGGLGSAPGVTMSPEDYLSGAYAASPSLLGHTDALNLHVYPGSTRLGAGTPFAQLFQDVRSVRAQYDDGAEPIFVSETGASTTSSWVTSEAEQADIVLASVRKLLTMPDVSGALVYTLLDRTSYPLDDPERGFGLLRTGTSPLEPKRAFCELSRMAGHLYSECPPLAVIESGPDGPIGQTAVEFGFTATEPAAAYECSLDGAPFAPCASPQSYSGLSDGDHTFAVRALDALGRSDPDPITRSFTVDTAPPDTQLWGPSGPIRDSSPQFGFSSSEPGGSFQCSLNGADWAACAPPYEPGPLADGDYVLLVRAVDAAGNADPQPARRSFTIDTRRPEVTITSGPDGPTTERQPTFQFASDEPGSSFRCAFNGNPLGACDAPGSDAPAGPYGDGSYSFQVVAIDPAGNWSRVAQRTFTVDTHGPAVSVDSGPTLDSPATTATPSFGLSASEPASLECRVDWREWSPCASPYEAPALADGSHTLYVRGTDALGNVGAVVKQPFAVDTTPPAPPAIGAGPDPLTAETTAQLSWEGQPGDSFECSLDGASFGPCASPLSLDGLAEGWHALRVRELDPAGNASAPATYAWRVDLTAPRAELASPKRRRTRDRTPTLRFAAGGLARSGGGPVTFACRLDGRAWHRCSSPLRLGPLRRGRHVVLVRAVDAAGNAQRRPTRAVVRILRHRHHRHHG